VRLPVAIGGQQDFSKQPGGTSADKLHMSSLVRSLVSPALPAQAPLQDRPIVGQSPALLKTIARTMRFAPAGAPVLVMGESGTGKELIARLLHDHGPSPAGPLVPVNCGALSRELAESELFGHERGAFTGAGARRSGWFEEASGGTLVLDEIGELPLELQPKLLRVLETGRLRRVGGRGETPVDVRVVALTLRDLPREVERGRFRGDLYHRLSSFQLVLPPLRERPGDVLLLAEHFLGELDRPRGPRRLTPAAQARLLAHRWPGNVRELRNVIRRAALLCESAQGSIDIEDLELPTGLAGATEGGRLADAGRAGEPGTPESPGSASGCGCAHGGATLILTGKTFLELELEIYRHFLRKHGGSRRRAARELRISRSTFCDRVKRYGL
jgi:DNA-binding NtrC family response regulator